MTQFKSLKKIITPIFFLIVIVFFIYYFRNLDLSKLKDVSIDYVELGWGMLFLLAARFWLAFTWGQLLKILGVENFAFVDLNYVYAKSWLGRYIPGKVAWILGKIYFASEHGVSKVKLGISSVLEVGIQVCVIILLGSGLIFFTHDEVIASEIKILMGVTCLVMSVVLLPPVFNYVLKKVYFVLKKENLTSTGYDNVSLLKMIGYFTVFGLVSGLSFFFIIRAFEPISTDLLAFVIGTLNLSGAAGILAIIAPSGIGVREGVQLALLQSFLSDEILVVILVVGRLVSTAADFLYYFCSLALARVFAKESSS